MGLAVPSANLSEFKDALKKEFDVDVSVSTISRLFEEMAIDYVDSLPSPTLVNSNTDARRYHFLIQLHEICG